MVKKDEQNFLTKQGYEKLVQELNDLKNIKLPKILERLAEAKALGDLSENFEYKSSLEDRELVGSRIAEIEDLLDNVEIIEDKKETKKKDIVVDYGRKVTVKLEDGKKYVFSIVGTGEVSVEGELNLSFESPLGIAVRGKKIGDKTKMKFMNGKKEVEIVNIE